MYESCICCLSDILSHSTRKQFSFRPGVAQTCLYSHRWLESYLDSGKCRVCACTIFEVKTAVLIGHCVAGMCSYILCMYKRLISHDGTYDFRRGQPVDHSNSMCCCHYSTNCVPSWSLHLLQKEENQKETATGTEW